MSSTLRQRSRMISLVVVLMAAGIFVVGESVVQTFGADVRGGDVASEGSESTVIRQISAFRDAERAHDMLTAPFDGGQTADGWFGRRAYSGAPPYIPHLVEEDRGIGGAECLTCHRDGGYVQRFSAYAPVTPHPEKTYCRQCHNPRRTTGVFVQSDFEPARPPALHHQVLPGSPPVIPHRLHMRENCLACHAGPGAVREWRTSHPDRVNCRQCHALSTTDSVWSRPLFVESE